MINETWYQTIVSRRNAMRSGFLKCLVLRRMHIWLFSSHLRKRL